MKRETIVTPKTYNRLTLIREIEQIGESRRFIATCSCGSGIEKIVTLQAVKQGYGKSCGCLLTESNKARATHRKSNTLIYNIWAGIKKRCLSPNYKAYKNYGGRGITMCDKWINSFEAFELDMGERPSPKHSVDRKDNSLGYTPENCRWATAKEQTNNMRTNHLMTVGCVTLNITQWSEEVGINKYTLLNRLKRGWTPEKTISTPVRGFHPHYSS